MRIGTRWNGSSRVVLHAGDLARAAVIVAWMLAVPATWAEDRAATAIDVGVRALPVAEAGTEIGETPPDGWSHLILFATPRLGSGDVDDVPRIAKRLATMFKLTILADVAGGKAHGGEYYLRQLAVGFAVNIKGKEVLVTSEKQKELGANLDFIARQVLVENERCMVDVRQVARTPTFLVFDAKSLVYIDDEHAWMICRHALLVDPRTGELESTAWLLEAPAAGRPSSGKSAAKKDEERYTLVDDHFRRLPLNLREDRVLNVRSDKFVLGVPTQEAFALVDLPPGDELPLAGELAELASLRRFTEDSVQELESTLAKTLAAAGPPPKAVAKRRDTKRNEAAEEPKVQPENQGKRPPRVPRR